MPHTTPDLYLCNMKLLLTTVPVLGFYDLSCCQLPGGVGREAEPYPADQHRPQSLLSYLTWRPVSPDPGQNPGHPTQNPLQHLLTFLSTSPTLHNLFLLGFQEGVRAWKEGKVPAEALPLTEPQDRSLSIPPGPTCLNTSHGICQRPPSTRKPYLASNEDFNNSCSTPPTLPPAPPLYAMSRYPAENNWGG